MTSTDDFRRRVRNAQSILSRRERGLLTGRNDRATAEAFAANVTAAAAILRAACDDPTDALPDYLDSPRGQRLADQFNSLERVFYGLY